MVGADETLASEGGGGQGVRNDTNRSSLPLRSLFDVIPGIPEANSFQP